MLVILPFYNEENRISIAEFQQMFSDFSDEEFLLVDDASTDATLKILTNFQQNFPNVSVFALTKNLGKAEAIRNAILFNPNSKSKIAYLDADLATPMEELYKMKVFSDKNPHYTFVMGSRIKRLGTKIERYSYRHYTGRIFATIISNIILKTPVYDTQCGAKVINADLAKELFAEPFVSKWLFDVELLLRYRNKESDFEKFIYEFPLSTWIEKGKSKIRFSDFLKFPFQLLKIHFHYAK